MHTLLVISIIALFIGIAIVIVGISEEDFDPIFIGLTTIVLDGIFGFGFLCVLIPVGTPTTKYLDPESVFIDEKYLVAVLDNEACITGESRLLEKSKEGIVKVKLTIELNSYDKEVRKKKSLEVFTIEEWDKMGLDDPNKGVKGETKDNRAKGD